MTNNNFAGWEDLQARAAETLERSYDLEIEGSLYLYTEFQPCESCNDVLRQFKEKFPNISVDVFWDYPYP